jgi:hypothetical protein
VPDFAMRSTWTRCRPNCCRWSTRRSSRPRPRCGFDHRRDRWGVAEGESPHPIRHERLHAMQFRGSPPPQVMDRRPVQPPDSSDRDCPPDTAGDRCLWHAGGTAGENDSARTWPLRLQLDCLVRPDLGDHRLVGKSPEGSRQPASATTDAKQPGNRGDHDLQLDY